MHSGTSVDLLSVAYRSLGHENYSSAACVEMVTETDPPQHLQLQQT